MFGVIFKPEAVRSLEKIPIQWRQRLFKAIDAIKIRPYIGKKLKGKFSGAFSLRVWPYRIIYTIDKSKITVIILDIGHRQGVYN